MKKLIWWLWIDLKDKKIEYIKLENWKKIIKQVKEIVDNYIKIWIEEFFIWYIPKE